MKKLMTVVMLVAVVMLAGNVAQAADYSEDFTTNPGWTYSGPHTPDSIAWENNATFGGIVNGTYYREIADTDNSFYYTSDLDDVMGKTVNDTWEWTMTFDYYLESGYKMYPSFGLSSTDFDGDTQPSKYIKWFPHGRTGYEQTIFKYNVGSGEVSSGNLGAYDHDAWYTVEIAFHTDDDKLYCKLIKKSDSSTVWSWTSSAISENFSFDTFNTWDYASDGSSTDATCNAYMDNLSIVPEPATMTLLLLGLPFALRRRR